MQHNELITLLGAEAESLLSHTCERIPKQMIHLPGPFHVENTFRSSNRSEAVIANLHRLYGHGHLADTGYLSIFPVDQGIEHTAGFSFAQNPAYFDPETIVKMALEAGCNGVASTAGVLGLMSKRYAERIPFIVKINHNELLTYPTKHDQVIFSSVRQAAELGAAGIGATIYFGAKESNKELVDIAQAFEEAHRRGMFTVLWCYPRNDAFKTPEYDYNESTDITSQAIHLGVTIGADIIKQKMPTGNHGFKNLKFAKYNDAMYELATDHPIDMVRYQVLNSYAGRISMINSGGESEGKDDLRQAVRTAVINKRGGGAGLIMGRKVFKRPFAEGIAMLRAVQAVYLDEEITVA